MLHIGKLYVNNEMHFVLEMTKLCFVLKCALHMKMGCLKTFVFKQPLHMGIGKNVQNKKTEPKQGKSLFWVTRRRTMVRQAAMFFYSKKNTILKKNRNSEIFPP